MRRERLAKAVGTSRVLKIASSVRTRQVPMELKVAGASCSRNVGRELEAPATFLLPVRARPFASSTSKHMTPTSPGSLLPSGIAGIATRPFGWAMRISLASAGSGPHLPMRAVHPGVSIFARACKYERAGSLHPQVSGNVPAGPGSRSESVRNGSSRPRRWPQEISCCCDTELSELGSFFHERMVQPIFTLESSAQASPLRRSVWNLPSPSVQSRCV